jgi:regulator of sigma E protease
MSSFLHTAIAFVAALTVLIAVHEFGHYWAARRLGVKVLRFSIGFGRPILRWSGRRSGTEFVVSSIPLGGYIRMADEREAPVAEADLPQAFNRQSLPVRAVIVAAGPVFNLLLAIALYWFVFLSGETGVRPVLGDVPEGTLAASAGFRSGDEILAVGDDEVPTWSEALGELMEAVLDLEEVPVSVRTSSGEHIVRSLKVPPEIAEHPEKLQVQLGFTPWQPELEPVVARIEPGSAAQQGGLEPEDRIVSVDGEVVTSWQAWVRYVRAHPGQSMRVLVDRAGQDKQLTITPASESGPSGAIGRIGAAVRVPEDVESSLRVTYRLGLLPALIAAVGKTYDYSALTLKLIGRMLIGRAALENLSGPLSIAQYAGATAKMGAAHFLKFLAAISVSLGVLNLLPIPVLDGGHLALYAVEALIGRPISERAMLAFQQVGIFILVCLMVLAVYLDLDRILN